jgi:hypothetical protein
MNYGDIEVEVTDIDFTSEEAKESKQDWLLDMTPEQYMTPEQFSKCIQKMNITEIQTVQTAR